MRTEPLVELIYDAAVDPKGWLAFAEQFQEAVGRGAVVVSVSHPSKADPGRVIAPSLEQTYVEAYQSHYFALDPFFPPAEQPAVGSFDFRPAREAQIEETAFYREWMQPQGLLPEGFLGGAVACDDEGGIVRIGIYSREGARPLGAAERRLGQSLMPHLRRAARIHFRRVGLEGQCNALSRAFDHVRLGLVLVDERGRVHATNQSADRLLAARDGIRVGREGLSLDEPQEGRRLQRLLGEAIRAETSEPGALRISRSSGGRPFEAAVVPLSAHSPAPEAGPRLAAVFLSDPEACGAAPLGMLRLFYDLTPSEAALAEQLARGSNLKQAAQELSVTCGTARQRLGLIFAKTETDRQAALVRLLLSGVSILRWSGARATPKAALDEGYRG